MGPASCLRLQASFCLNLTPPDEGDSVILSTVTGEDIEVQRGDGLAHAYVGSPSVSPGSPPHTSHSYQLGHAVM